MFDFDASKFILIGIVALIFIGPKELPGVLRQVGQFVAKMRRMAAEFQGQFMDAMKEADVASLKDDMAKLQDSARLNVNFSPVADIKNSIEQSVMPGPVHVPAAPGAPSAPLDLPPAPEVPPPVLPPEAKDASPAPEKPRKRAKMASSIDGDTPKPRKRSAKAAAEDGPAEK